MTSMPEAASPPGAWSSFTLDNPPGQIFCRGECSRGNVEDSFLSISQTFFPSIIVFPGKKNSNFSLALHSHPVSISSSRSSILFCGLFFSAVTLSLRRLRCSCRPGPRCRPSSPPVHPFLCPGTSRGSGSQVTLKNLADGWKIGDTYIIYCALQASPNSIRLAAKKRVFNGYPRCSGSRRVAVSLFFPLLRYRSLIRNYGPVLIRLQTLLVVSRDKEQPACGEIGVALCVRLVWIIRRCLDTASLIVILLEHSEAVSANWKIEK